MYALALSAKAAVAVLLLVAGAAKLADLAGFAAAVRLFLPTAAVRLVGGRVLAVGAAVATAEVLAGVISLCVPAARWMNLVVLALAAAFVVVAAAGYARHRGRPCRCFGALTRREFGPRALVQAVAVTAAAALAISHAPPAQLRLGAASQLLLFAATGLVGVAAFTAARALRAAGTEPGMAG